MRRAWHAPLWAHAAVLACLLGALFFVMHPTSSFTSDEGAYALQVKALEAGSWAYDYRAARFDPEGSAFPVVLSERGPSGYYPYVKHPVYPLLLRASTGLLGRTVGLHLPSLLGVVGAAAAAWLLAGELDPRLRRPAFWLAAGGPVLANGFVIWAHAPSAALAGFALLGAARMARGGVTRWPMTGMTAALVGGALLRSEGLLLAGALAVVFAVVRYRQAGRPAEALAVVALAAGPTVLASLAERRWVSSILSGSYGAVAGQGGAASSFLGGRWSGAWHELFQGHFIDQAASVPVLAALALVVGGGLLALRRSGTRSTWTLVAVLVGMVALLGARYAIHPYDPVTGLLPAWPLAVVGVLLFRWRGAGPVAVLLGGTVALFTAAVVATQYPEGGGLEWGGRYLSPAIVPLAVLAAAGLLRAVNGAPGSLRPRAVVLLAGIGLAGSVFSMATVGALRAREDAIVAAVSRYPSAVTVTTRRALPRLAWRADDDLTWMLTDEAGLPGLLGGLRAQGVDEVSVLVGLDVPLSAMAAYPSLQEQDEPALLDDGMKMVVARDR